MYKDREQKSIVYFGSRKHFNTATTQIYYRETWKKEISGTSEFLA